MWDNNYNQLKFSNLKGAGRKPKELQNRRAENIRVRLTEAELEQIQLLHRKTKQDSISGLIRAVLFKEKISVRVTNKEVLWLASDLSDLSGQVTKLLRAKSPKIESLEEKIAGLDLKLQQAIELLENLVLKVNDLTDV